MKKLLQKLLLVFIIVKDRAHTPVRSPQPNPWQVMRGRYRVIYAAVREGEPGYEDAECTVLTALLSMTTVFGAMDLLRIMQASDAKDPMPIQRAIGALIDLGYVEVHETRSKYTQFRLTKSGRRVFGGYVGAVEQLAS